LGNGGIAGSSSPVSVVGGFADWVQIDTTALISSGIRANGTAWMWGRNLSGQLGNNTTTSASSPVSVIGGFSDWVMISPGYNAIGLRG
jgi:alpha-tubulin suppressor-like RCC1 family protein